MESIKNFRERQQINDGVSNPLKEEARP